MKKIWVFCCLMFWLLLPGIAVAENSLIAFTFDDGPSAHTAGLLDGLRERGAVATFFMNGSNGGGGIINYTGVVQRMQEEGHQLANHTYYHRMLSGLSAESIRNEAVGVENLLFRIKGGSYVDMVRSPGGENNATIRSSIEAPLILWSVDTLDWKYRDADSVYNRILNGAKDGSIVLMHDLYPTSISGALRAIDTLQAQGYEFVTVAELLRRRGITPQNGVVYTQAYNQGQTLPAYNVPSVQTQIDTVSGSIQAICSTPDAGITLYYTKDGTLPTLASPVYQNPVPIVEDTTLVVAGFDAYGTRTPATEPIFIPYMPTPQVASWQNGILTLTSSIPGCPLYYTTDGSMPNQSATRYEAGFAPGIITRVLALQPGRSSGITITLTQTRWGDLFMDVPADAWYFAAMENAIHEGWLLIENPYHFAPEASISRALLCYMFYQLSGTPNVLDHQMFPDLEAGAWYVNGILWMKEQGLIVGETDGNFAPDIPITREELAAILFRYAQSQGLDMQITSSLPVYADAADIAEYALPALTWCVQNGLMSGMDKEHIGAKQPVTRAQCAFVLDKLYTLLQEEIGTTGSQHHHLLAMR